MPTPDPYSGDYTLTEGGDLAPADNQLVEALLLRCRTRRGSVFWDKTFGSTLHELACSKSTTRTQRDIEDRIRRALAPMVDAREISDVSFEHSRTTGGWDVRVVVKDAQKKTVSFDLWVEVT